MDTAQAFALARRQGRGLAEWPGEFPHDLQQAYALQRGVARAWGRASGGMKVGRVLGEWAQRCGVDRFTGPVDAGAIHRVEGDGEALFPVICGGTALLECEIIAVLGDAPVIPSGAVVSPEEARALVASLHLGIEVAGSPLADINALGPLASIACFGNNNGAILGSEVHGWQEMDLESVGCVALIDGTQVGRGDASRLPGGVWTALAFALMQGASSGEPLGAGDIVCTGALTGMHPLVAGQVAVADFGVLGSVRCRAVDAAKDLKG